MREIEASWPLMPQSKQHLDVDTYEGMADEFNPMHYDPKEWTQVIKNAGAKYVVLTAKHHDGFCLFDTQTTDYCATKRGLKRDLIAPYAEAIREAGMKVGLYFRLV